MKKICPICKNEMNEFCETTCCGHGMYDETKGFKCEECGFFYGFSALGHVSDNTFKIIKKITVKKGN